MNKIFIFVDVVLLLLAAGLFGKGLQQVDKRAQKFWTTAALVVSGMAVVVVLLSLISNAVGMP